MLFHNPIAENGKVFFQIQSVTFGLNLFQVCYGLNLTTFSFLVGSSAPTRLFSLSLFLSFFLSLSLLRMSTITGVGRKESEEVEKIKKEIAVLQKKLKEARLQAGMGGIKKKEEANARSAKVRGEEGI